MPMKKLSPLHDVVIIKRQVVDEVNGILIPISSEDFREDVGTVAYTGPGALRDDGELNPMYVKPGDKVLFSTHGHQVTKVDGEELIVLRQNSIIGVFREKENKPSVMVCPKCGADRTSENCRVTNIMDCAMGGIA